MYTAQSYMCIIIHACYIHQHDKADLGYRSAWHIHIANGYIHFHRVKVKWLFVHFIKDMFDVMRQKDGSFLIEPMTPWIELPVLHHWFMTTGQPPAAHNPLYFFILQARATAWGLIYPYTVQWLRGLTTLLNSLIQLYALLCNSKSWCYSSWAQRNQGVSISRIDLVVHAIFSSISYYTYALVYCISI